MDVRPQTQLRPPRRTSLLVLVIAVAVASALLAFAVVSAGRSPKNVGNKSSSPVPAGGTIPP
jgi:hypothetical protein